MSECAKALNQLLKGTHMGATLFEDLEVKVKDEKLKQLIDDCLKRLRKHEELLSHHVEQMQEAPSEDGGFFGAISELGAMMRQAVLDDEQDLVGRGHLQISRNKAHCEERIHKSVRGSINERYCKINKRHPAGQRSC